MRTRTRTKQSEHFLEANVSVLYSDSVTSVHGCKLQVITDRRWETLFKRDGYSRLRMGVRYLRGEIGVLDHGLAIELLLG